MTDRPSISDALPYPFSPSQDPLISAAAAGVAAAPVEEAMAAPAGWGRRKAILVALSDPWLAAAAFYRLPKTFAVAPVAWDMALRECAAAFDRIEPAALVTDRLDSVLAQAAAIRGLPVIGVSARRTTGSAAPHVEASVSVRPRRAATARSYPLGTALILQTSGTTGAPKVVALTRSNLAHSVANIVGALDLGPGDRTLATLSLTHIHGIVAVLHAALESGGTLMTTPPLDPAAFWRAAPSLAPTWFSVVPTLLGAICDDAPERPSDGLQNLRFVRSASSSLPAAVRARAEALFGAPVVEAYGMTEACHQMTSNTPALNRPGSVGRAGPRPKIAVLDRSGAPAPAGETGEICVRGRNMFRGYASTDAGPRRWWRRPTTRSDTHRGRWFRTGDLGRIDADGYLWIVGRIKEQINRGGETLSPVDIEEALLSLPAVRSAVVFPLPHPTLGEEVAAVCVRAPGAAASEADLIGQASKVLSFAGTPKRIFLVDAAPTALPSGKISRRMLTERYAEHDPFGARGKPAAVPPAPFPDDAPAATVAAGETIDRIDRIFRDALALDRLDREASFFELGGTSLEAARIFAAIKRDCDVDLPIVTIVAHPSVAAMSRAVAAARDAARRRTPPKAPRAPAAPRMTPLPQSLADFCVAQTLDAARDDLRQAFVVAFDASVEPADLERALFAMAAGHMALRCAVRQVAEERFAFVDAGPQPSAVVVIEDPVGRWTDSAALRAFLRDPLPLDTAPLLRVAALRLSDGGCVYAFKVSEIILDGYARMTFLAELAGRLSGAPQPTGPDRFVEVLQRARPVRADAAPFADPDETHHAPGDLLGERTARRAARIVRLQDAGWWDALEGFARRCGATPFAAALGVFAGVLERLAGGPVGILLSVQRRSGPEDYRTIGNFVDRVLVRIAADPDDSFAQLAHRATAILLEAAERSPHHSIAFGERVVMFEIEDELDGLIRSGEGSGAATVERLRSMRIEEAPPSSVTGALTLALRPGGDYGRKGPPSAVLTYDAAAFGAGRAEAILDAFLSLLDHAMADPDRAVAATPMTAPGALNPSAAESPAVRLAAPIPAGLERLEDLFAFAAARAPDATALVFPEGALSFAEVDAAADAIASELRRIGGAAGRPVAFWDAPRPKGEGVDLVAGWSPLYAVAGLAILKARGVALPVGKSVPPAQMAGMAANAGVGLIACGAADLPDDLAKSFEPLSEVATPCGPLRLFGSRAAPRATPVADGSAYLMHSSGTTGAPKGILQSHRAMIELVEAALATGMWPDGNVMPGHDIGFDVFTAAVWLSWASGRAAHAPRVFDYSPAALAELRAAGVRSFMTSPTVAAALATQDPSCLSGFEVIVLTGEELPPSVAKRLLDLPGATRFANFYGPTETTVWASFEPIAAPLGPRVAIGKALKGYQLEVADPRTLLPMPVDLPGEILIGAPSALLGYLANDAANSRAFVTRPGDGRTFYRSGDIGWIDRDGRLHYAGRRDRQVQMSGIRVELGGVEAVLAEVEGVAQAAVVDAPTPSGPYLAAFLVPTSPDVDAGRLASAATEAARRRLPASSAPQAVWVVGHLPASRSGKVDFDALRRQAAEMRGSVGPKRAIPKGGVEADIAAIWSDLLDRADLSLDDDFQKSGGTSLGMMRLATRLRGRFGVDVAVGELFFTRTIAAQSDLVRSRAPDARRAPARPRARPAHGPGLLDISGPGSYPGAARDRPWLVGLPMSNGTTGALGQLGELLHQRYDFSFVEATKTGRRRFKEKNWLEIAEEACRLLEDRIEPGGELPILCGYSLGGWLAWLTERVWTARRGARGPRIVNIDSGALHLKRPGNLPPELHAMIARADAIAEPDMLLVSRDNDAGVAFMPPNLWSKVAGSFVRAPRAKTLLHIDMNGYVILEAAMPFIERWIAGDRGAGWPEELSLAKPTAGTRLYDLSCERASDPAADYAVLRADFLLRERFLEGALIFEMLALKTGDAPTAFEFARRHLAAAPESRYAVAKQMAIWGLQGEREKMETLAASWAVLHPDDALIGNLLAGPFDPRWRARPKTKLAANVKWWMHFFSAMTNGRTPGSAPRSGPWS